MRQTSTSTLAAPGEKMACGMCVLETGDESQVNTTVRMITPVDLTGKLQDATWTLCGGKVFRMCLRHAMAWETASTELTEDEATAWEILDR